MAAADQTLLAAFTQERGQSLQCRERFPFQSLDLIRRENEAMLVEDRRVVADELFERRYPGSGFDALGALDRFTCAAERKCAVAFACDWHEPAIELGREFAIDFKFGLARGFPFSQCRKIKKWIAHGAFDLERPPAGKKYKGGVCLMASYFHYRARRGVG